MPRSSAAVGCAIATFDRCKASRTKLSENRIATFVVRNTLNNES